MLEETHDEETYEGWVYALFCKDSTTEYIGDDEQPEQDGDDEADKKETASSKKTKDHEHHDHELDRETDHKYIGQSYAHPVEKFMNSNE